jgi:hypothetical protein
MVHFVTSGRHVMRVVQAGFLGVVLALIAIAMALG